MNRLIKSIISVVSVIVISQGTVSADEVAMVNWTCVSDQEVSSTGGRLAGLPSGGTMTVRDYTGVLNDGSEGPLGKYQRWWIAANWPDEDSQNDTRYIEFKVMPESGFDFHGTVISLYLNAGGTGNMKANVCYATSPDFSTPVLLEENISVSRDEAVLDLYDIDADVPEGSYLYFRIYPWLPGGSTNTGKYVLVQDVTISGTTSAVTFPASATWELTDPAGGGTGLTAATSGQVTADDEYLNNMEINQYTGPGESQRLRIAGDEWPANQTEAIDSVYVQFAASPQGGYTFHASMISLEIAAASITSMKANILYSTDPAFSHAETLLYSTGLDNNYLPDDTLIQVQAGMTETVEPGQTFYLRINPWVDNDPDARTGKYVALKNVVISGSIEGNPTEAQVTWSFETDDGPVSNGPLVAETTSYSEAMKFYGTTQLPKTDTGETVTVGAIQTVSRVWNAEPVPTDSLWFQFAAGPKFGGTFFIDSVSMYLGGWYTQNLKAAVYGSKDPAFSEKALLLADTLLPGNEVMPFSLRLNETVDSGETYYLRVYPHNTAVEGWAKLVAVHQVVIHGTVTGVTADPPSVETASVSYISTGSALSGGTIPSDGGAPVSLRGVVWNTAGSPTAADSKTEDGGGSGSFTSRITGLLPGTDYYLRAYAINDAGTAYGDARTFRTLDSTDVPSVFTSSVSDILVKTAECGGIVTSWGGDTVSVRGVCWNTTGEPTVADAKTENGSGLGTFVSVLYPLTENTQYYVRAYATNSKGTGYGEVREFTTKTPMPDVEKVVAQDGSGDYTTVQAAFDDVPDYYTGNYAIKIRNGVYYEKLFLDRNKVNVMLVGSHPDSVILTYDDYAGKDNLGTAGSYSVAIEPDDFSAINITFRNTLKNDGSFNDQQAVALRTNGDRQTFYNCKIRGYQDTFYAWGGRGTGRNYFNNCYIEGSVDFIFGRNIVVFDSCTIKINRNGGSLTAASTEKDSKHGLVFLDCIITADAVGFNGTPITSFILGRPWQQAPRTVYIRCEEPASLTSPGWSSWNVTPALYAEYECYGPGSDYSSRLSISRQLTPEEAAEHTVEKIFSKESNPGYAFDWIPDDRATGLNQTSQGVFTPDAFRLWQNYPNPFNAQTVIRYRIPAEGSELNVKSYVTLCIYNCLGQKITTLVSEKQLPESYRVEWDAGDFPSGVYYCQLAVKNGRKEMWSSARKLVLIK